ncbi:MAG: Fe-S oxidoreductase [Candidatus Stahlbacteria bacterium]|nr:MAG: Fe-S oxidoreductase [Candidatus Stahlbacteria bacterium]
MMKKRILLVEPDFPIPAKSKNHKNFLPIGLLKIASYLRDNRIQVQLVRGVPKDLQKASEIREFKPKEIWVTSLFTYWASFVKESVHYYKKMFPRAKIVVGGIYASLFSRDEVKEYTGCNEVHQGIIPGAEKYPPAYDLLENANPHPIDYQIIHASRGCERHCTFCGTWKIEPEFIPKESIKDEIHLVKLVFYDNNFLMNPYIENILGELMDLKQKKEILWCESQSGFDGRILLENPHLATMLKKAGFRYPRIAWDGRYDEHPQIKSQLDALREAGYRSKDIYVFMLYNWHAPFEEMEKKRLKCWDWKVQIADCRFRPLSQLYDNYNPRAKEGQPSSDYYIHEGWTDAFVRQFRRNVREQNICVRQELDFYSSSCEHKKLDRGSARVVKTLKGRRSKERFLKARGIRDYWFPGEVRYPL